MSPQLRKKARGLLILFLLLYAAFTLIPAGIYGAYRLQEGKSAPVQTAVTPTSSPSPGTVSSPAPASGETSSETASSPETPTGDSSSQEQSSSESSLESAPSPSPSAQPSPSEIPGFLEGRTMPSTPPSPEEEGFTLYDTATGETFSVSVSEFLPAALACEMDLSAPEEALKAQAVALYSFYSYQKAKNQGESADFACDSANWLVYVPQSAMEERWGEDFSTYYQKLTDIVSSVKGQLLTWEGSPICAAFFSISGGNTESAFHVWGEDFPYLQSQSSPGDCFAAGYLSQVSLTAEEVRQKAEELWSGEVDFSGPEEDWICALDISPSGYVNSAQVGGRTCTGEELREVFGLRSACFQLAYSQGTFQFTVHGWGHGVGMSQAGAIFLANQGAGYQEILAHYYPGTTLEGIS